MSKDEFLRYEEDFHAKDRKMHRKERKEASQKDRSKYKKSDQDQKKKLALDSLPLEKDETLSKGLVLAVTSEGIAVTCENHIYLCSLKGNLKQEKSRNKNLIVVGDEVLFTPQNQTEGVIAQIEKRHSILSRADNLSRRKQQLIAVNINQVLIASSVLLPPIKPYLIDRYIIAAKKGNLTPIIVINKIDLLDTPPKEVPAEEVEKEKRLYEELLVIYRDLQIPVYPVSAKTGQGIEELKKAMQNTTSVFSGQSGVGKSSLINLVVGTDLPIGNIVEKTSKGSHTTSTAHLLPLATGGFCIDTPGIKSFGIWDLEKKEIQEHFPEIYYYSQNCKFPDCRHMHEPGCAVIKAVEENLISSLRFASYSALIEDLSKEHQHR